MTIDIKKDMEALRDLQQKMNAYDHAIGVLYLDGVTAAPFGTASGRGRTMGVLSEASHRLFANDEVGELLERMSKYKEALDLQTKREVEELTRSYQRLFQIPAAEYAAYATLVSDAEAVWEKAKTEADFPAFRPYLEKIIDYQKRFAAYYDSEKAPYDALLDQYERGTTMAQLDNFFSRLKERLSPLVAEIAQQPAPEDGFLHRPCPRQDQQKLSARLMEIMGLDPRYAALSESEHPFTTNFNKHDVRITTHYYEDDVASSMFSVIHEGGHALYELHIADELDFTCLGTGVSMGVHESQSRFYENIIGRSREFTAYLLPVLKQLFPGSFADVSAEQFYRAVNKVQPSLIRTEADELTYPFHIMVRYELEKQLIEGTLTVADLPEAWNALYKELLGVDVPDDRHGVLQDSHWAGGSIGYFPSYALGNAYGAQMLHVMEQELPDMWKGVGEGDLSAVSGWLAENVHLFGCLRTPAETVEFACRGSFDPEYYLAYLDGKYRDIYGLR